MRCKIMFCALIVVLLITSCIQRTIPQSALSPIKETIPTITPTASITPTIVRKHRHAFMPVIQHNLTPTPTSTPTPSPTPTYTLPITKPGVVIVSKGNIQSGNIFTPLLGINPLTNTQAIELRLFLHPYFSLVDYNIFIDCGVTRRVSHYPGVIRAECEMSETQIISLPVWFGNFGIRTSYTGVYTLESRVFLGTLSGFGTMVQDDRRVKVK